MSEPDFEALRRLNNTVTERTAEVREALTAHDFDRSLTAIRAECDAAMTLLDTISAQRRVTEIRPGVKMAVAPEAAKTPAGECASAPAPSAAPAGSSPAGAITIMADPRDVVDPNVNPPGDFGRPADPNLRRSPLPDHDPSRYGC